MRILLLLSLLVVFGCKDQATDTKTQYVTRDTPTLCPDPGTDNNYPEPPMTNFLGIEKITEVEQTKATIHWQQTPDAKAYMILKREIGASEFELVKTKAAASKRAMISNLSPGTQYEFMVRMLDSRGMPDQNENLQSATTSGWPTYNNAKSLAFNGVKSVTLKASDELAPNNTFTVSLWVKSNNSTQRDARLFNFHKSSGASSAVFLAMDNQKINLGYRDSNDDFKTESINLNLADNEWHHIALTRNNRFYVVYIDGVRELRLEDSFIGLGSHPAHIGSYTGSQKAFVGLIDEVSIWKSSLGSTDVVNIYNQGTPYYLPRHRRAQFTLQAWYRLGDDSRDNANIIYDQVNDFNGIPNNINTGDFKTDAP